MNKKVAIFSILFIVLDQLIKVIVTNNIGLDETVVVINNFFNLTYVQNFGAAWSLFNGYVEILSVVALLALVFIYFAFIHKKELNKLESITYSLLIGGIIGNLIDRVLLGYVVDYLSFNIFGYMFPVFNLADMGIVISVFLLIIISILEDWLCKRSK